MKNKMIISLLLISMSGYAQIDWPNYATHINGDKNRPHLGPAVPYNGIFDNFEQSVVGISNWNPQYKLDIDPSLDENIPLFFVYDTAAVYLLAPNVNRNNAKQFEYTVITNNKTVLTPWSKVERFTELEVGNMKPGSGIIGPYHTTTPGQYLVAHLRNAQGAITSSVAVYLQKKVPVIRSIRTSDKGEEFIGLTSNKQRFGDRNPQLGWHRQYSIASTTKNISLNLTSRETNVLIDVDAEVYKKAALEYTISRNGRSIRNWYANEYNNNYILLQDLKPGQYTVQIRLKRQRNSIRTLYFTISPSWYKTTAFKVTVLAAIGLLLTLLSVIVKYRRQKQTLFSVNKQADKTETDLKNIHMLLNPHFTFNALSSIQGLINKEDIPAANKYLSSFAELLRETLNESRFDQIPLKKELGNLTTYVELEQLRHTFTWKLVVDSNIDLNSNTIPPFLLQPFVENAIKHGLSTNDASALLVVNVKRDQQTLTIEITDNGHGFDPTSTKEGNGLYLSRRRIALLNREYQEQLIHLDINSTTGGTTVLLSFKNWL